MQKSNTLRLPGASGKQGRVLGSPVTAPKVRSGAMVKEELRIHRALGSNPNLASCVTLVKSLYLPELLCPCP